VSEEEKARASNETSSVFLRYSRWVKGVDSGLCSQTPHLPQRKGDSQKHLRTSVGGCLCHKL
jgi:hypothetical protein